MNVLGLWAANKAALAAGFAINASPAVRVSPLDGFAIGSLLCGACILVATSPRRPWRSLLSRRERTAVAAGAHRSGPGEPRTGRPRAEARRVAPRAEACRVVRPADTHRAAPRHAAPPAGLAGRMTGLLSSRAMAGSAMAGRAMAGSGMGASARD